MTSKLLKEWLIALLADDTTLADLLPTPGVFGAGVELPSRTGVYVGITSQSPPEQHTDECSPTITVLAAEDTPQASEELCYAVLSRVTTLLNFIAGMSKTWGVDPAEHGLRVRGLVQRLVINPEREDELSTAYRATMTYEFKGYAVPA